MANVPIIRAPDEGQLGPAMLALPTDRWRGFVCALLELGDNNHSRAALAAGYGGDAKTIGVTAHRLAHDDRTQAAIHEESVRRLNTGKIMAVSTLLKLGASAQKDSDKLRAVEMILNRTGMGGLTEHRVTTVDASKTDEAMIARIEEICKARGLDSAKLLGKYAPQQPAPIDAEFTVVEEGHSSEGLEDIL